MDVVLNFLNSNAGWFIIGMACIIILLLVLLIVNMVKINGMKKKYDIFMKGENAKSLEKTLIKRLEQLDALQESDVLNRKNIKRLFDMQVGDVQKVGMVKYDAFDEMGGKLSFSLAFLNQEDTGIVMNVVHTREGCYTYVKEIIKGNSVLVLTEEEREAIDNALTGAKYDKKVESKPAKNS